MDARWNTANPIRERSKIFLSQDFFKAKAGKKFAFEQVDANARKRYGLREYRGLERSLGDIKNGGLPDAIP